MRTKSTDTAASNIGTTDPPKAEDPSDKFDKLITRLCQISQEHPLFSPDTLTRIPHLHKDHLVYTLIF